jgi:hypothetical protein
MVFYCNHYKAAAAVLHNPGMCSLSGSLVLAYNPGMCSLRGKYPVYIPGMYTHQDNSRLH